MKRWTVISSYGGLTVSKIVEADDAKAAWEQSGVLDVLRDAGFAVFEEDATYEVYEEVAT